MPNVPPPIIRLYTERLAPRSSAYRAADAALVAADAAAKKERQQADSAVTQIEAPYKLARSIVRARVKELEVPETLAALHTDTDRKLAIGELLADDFGTMAPEAIREIDESVLASASLKGAAEARAAAAGPAYEEYLSFKAAVLAGMGRKSAAYQRLTRRIRSSAGDDAEPLVEEPAGEIA
jgi:hypothetical protein